MHEFQRNSRNVRKFFALPVIHAPKNSPILRAQKMGQLEGIAEVAVFLASDDSAFINGAVIRGDGGESINAWAP